MTFCQRRGELIHHLIMEIEVAAGCVVWFSPERYILIREVEFDVYGKRQK